MLLRQGLQQPRTGIEGHVEVRLNVGKVLGPFVKVEVQLVFVGEQKCVILEPGSGYFSRQLKGQIVFCTLAFVKTGDRTGEFIMNKPHDE